jgi:arylsulfatase
VLTTTLLFALLGCSDKPADTAAPAEPLLVFEGARPSNVLMISIDTLRRDRLGRYDGSDRTPNLDRLLSEGFALDDHRSCANWTWSSLACALSGRGLPELGVLSIGPATQPPAYPEDEPMLSGWLKEEGYVNGLVSASPFLTAQYNATHDYDYSTEDSSLRAAEIVDAGLSTLETLRADGRPWLLHLHFLDPHTPYDPPEEYRIGLEDIEPVTEFNLSTHEGAADAGEAWDGLSADLKERIKATIDVLYNGELMYMDTEIGRLLATLEASGDLDNTLVVLWSDHGEQFWDHGEFSHRRDLHNEEAAALGGFWAASLARGATTLPTIHYDLAPTILEALGLAPREEIIGEVLGTFSNKRPRFSHSMRDEVSLQSVDFKGRRLIYSWSGVYELYNLVDDPGERFDLYAQEVEDAQGLISLLEPEVERYQALMEAAKAASEE